MLYKLEGYLQYQILPIGHKLTVEGIDRGIVDFYRSLIPKSKVARPQKYSPHISVVRKEIPTILESWGKYEGKKVTVYYDSYLHCGTQYWWLDVYSKELEAIREELGLSNTKYDDREMPEGFSKRFHMTVANFKQLT